MSLAEFFMKAYPKFGSIDPTGSNLNRGISMASIGSGGLGTYQSTYVFSKSFNATYFAVLPPC